MEIRAIVEALKATTVAESQGNATEYLKEVSKMIGFSQILLKLTTDESLEVAVRQAAVIYLKNIVHKRWVIDEGENEMPLSEQDKAPLRQDIIPAINHSPDALRIHLCSCIQYMMRSDYPENWPNLLEQIIALLHTPNGVELHGTLLIVHKLCKIYEYKSQKEKSPLVDAMKSILPLLYQRFISLISDNSQASCLLQKIMLKIFYCLIQFSLNLKMISIEEFGNWLRLFSTVVQRPVPDECKDLSDSMEDTVFWKCKKWAMKIIARVFERYGSKGQVEDVYVTFAEYYSKEFAVPMVNLILNDILTPYVHKAFVSSRVLHLAITYLADAISHAQIWIIVKEHLQEILKTVIFPLLMHSADDEQLWEEDPEEYLRFRFDTMEDMHSPTAAAGHLLQMMSRRVGVIMPMLQFAFSNLNAESSPFEVDGALHMLCVLAPTLIKNKKYKKEVQNLVDAHVVPRISHAVRFVRARACSAAKCNSEAVFTTARILSKMVTALIQRLVDEKEELPVKVEAAIAISALLHDQEAKVLAIIKPHVREVLMEVLRLIARTQIDDLPQVVEALIDNFEEDVIPVACDVAHELVNIFNRLTGLSTEGEEVPEISDDVTITVMGVLQTIERVLCLVEEHEEIVKNIEPIVRGCIISIFENFCTNYFEEGLSLTQTLISVRVSPEMWCVFDLIYKSFLEEGPTFFIDCMPTLHCYLTVDTESFLAEPTHARWLLEMCEKTVRDNECGEEAQIHAVKLFEVFILQCMGRVDNYVPAILQLVYERCTQPHESDLYAQLLVVFVAAFYYNPELYVQTMAHMKPEPLNGIEWLASEIIKNHTHFDGIHNRKMILYFMSKMLSLPVEHIPSDIRASPKALTELCISQFDNLQKCIKALAESRVSDESSSEGTSDDEDRMMDELKDSDDDVDEGTLEYLESLKRRNQKKANDSGTIANGIDHMAGDAAQNVVSVADVNTGGIVASTDGSEDDDDDYDDYDVEAELDEYETPLDSDESGINVFLLFKEAFQGVQESNPLFFQALITGLDEQKTAELHKLMTVCTQQENLELSKRVAQSGGYIFDATAGVPTNFKFS